MHSTVIYKLSTDGHPHLRFRSNNENFTRDIYRIYFEDISISIYLLKIYER